MVEVYPKTIWRELECLEQEKEGQNIWAPMKNSELGEQVGNQNVLEVMKIYEKGYVFLKGREN